jgi:hypothetical protein
MDLQKQARLGWIAATVMLGVAIVLTFLLLDARDPRNLDDVSAQVREACLATDSGSREACASALTDIQALLADIRDGRANPGAQPEAGVPAPAPAATATPVI